MRENPRCLAIVKCRVHLRSRRDAALPVTVQAEPLCVVAGLAVSAVGEHIDGMSLDEVRAVEPPGFRRGVATSADLLGVALRAVRAAAGSRGTVTRRKTGGMYGQRDARGTDPKSRFDARPGKRANGCS